MYNRDYGLWLIPVLAVLAIYFPSASNRQAEPTPVSTAPATPNLGDPASRAQTGQSTAERLIRAYSGRTSRSGDMLAPGSTIDSVIATVPDPVDSSLSHLFDRYVGAIQRAAEAAGYVADRFDLPWLRNERRNGQDESSAASVMSHSPSGASATAVSNAKLEPDELRNLPLHEREPGVILFRHKEYGKLLAVFLVGESPTRGIHKTSFKRALEQAHAICTVPGTSHSGRLVEAQGRRCPDQVNILSPSFSGSADSLVNAFATSGKMPKVKIVSGSATVIDAEYLPSKISQCTTTAGCFKSYLFQDDQTAEYLVRFLDEKQIRVREVAILTESNTEFGRGLQEAMRRRTSRESPLFLTYPLHISQLRTAAEKEKTTTRNGAADVPRTKPGNLQLSLEDASRPRDVITNSSPFETFSTELVLANLLAAISREGIRYVGLFPTDVRDQIFLTREIRKHAPNTVLFTFGADLLYLHSDVNLDFYGMLLFSTYPLFSMNQIWTESQASARERGRSRLHFANDSTQGVYNAMLDLLNRQDLQLEYNFPFKEGSSGPALWLSAVGKNDLWPIRILNRDALTIDRQFLPAISEAAAIYSRPLVFVSALLALLCLLAAGALTMELAAKDGTLSRLSDRFARCFNLRREVLLHKYIRPKLNWYLKICGEAVFPDQSAYRRAFILSLAVSSSVVSLVLFSVFLRFFLFSAKPWSILSLWNRWTSFLLLAFFATGTALTAMLLVGRKVFPLKPRDLRTFHRINPKRLYVLLAFIGGTLACAAVGFFLPSMISRHAASLLLIAALFFALLIGFLSTRQPAARASIMDSHDQDQRLRRIQTDLSCFVVAAVPILIFCVAAFQVFDIVNMDEATKLFYHLRTVNLTSGLSPLLPLFFVALAAVLWTVCSLRRLRMLEELIGPNEAGSPQLLYLGQESAKTLNAFERRIKELLTGEFFHLPGAPLILFFIGVPCFILFLVRLVPSIEGSGFYLFFGISFFAVYLALTFTFLRFLCVWRETHLLLNYLSSHSLSVAYGEFAKTGDSMPKLDMSDAFAPYRALKFVAEYAGRCVITAKERDVPRLLNLSAMADSRGHWERAIKLRHCAQRSLSIAAAQVGAALESPSVYSKEWIQDARRFLAARTVLFLHHVLSHLQNLLLFVVAGLILMLLAITYYPFQPREWLLWFNWVVIIATVSLTAAVFVQMGRNRVLSILSNTTPGQVTWTREFLFRVLLYVIVPVLTLLGAQFPESMRSILSWLGAFQNS